MYKHMRNQKNQANQQGIVAIVVTIILMIVITLIVLSFAKISRREQRNALDRQLSTQAFYAAESGVNLAAAELSTWEDDDPGFNENYMSSCTQFASDTSIILNSALTTANDASLTCLFVNAAPKQLIYAKSDEQRILPLKNKNPALALNTLEIYWDNGAVTQDFSNCAAMTANPTLGTCTAPVLRVELVDAAALTISKVFFIYPSASTTDTISFGSTNGQNAQAPCSTAVAGYNRCRVKIAGLTSLSGYYLRVRGIYDSAAIQIEAGGGNVELIGAQAIIDVTGKASDVLRRIQVRAPTTRLSSKAPLFIAEGTDKICKKFIIDGTNAIDMGSCSPGFPD